MAWGDDRDVMARDRAQQRVVDAARRWRRERTTRAEFALCDALDALDEVTDTPAWRPSQVDPLAPPPAQAY